MSDRTFEPGWLRRQCERTVAKEVFRRAADRLFEEHVGPILDAREEKAEPAGDWPRDDKEPRGCPTPGACSAAASIEALERERDAHERYLAQNDESANAWYARAEKAEVALAERDARIEALERDLAACRESQALTDSCRDTLLVEKQEAEAALADLRGRVEKATNTVSQICAWFKRNGYDAIYAELCEALALLSPEGEAKREKSAGSHDPAGTAVPGRGSDTVEGVDQNDRGSAPDRRDPRHSQPPRDADPVPAPGWRPVTDEAKTGERVLLWVCSRGSIRRGIAQIGWWGHHREFGRTWLLRPDQPIDVDAVRLWMPIEKPDPARSAGITQGASDER